MNTIAVRINRRNGQREYRAYPWGTAASGVGPWVESCARARAIRDTANAVDTE